MRPSTSVARSKRRHRRAQIRNGGTAHLHPVGTRWPLPAAQPAHLQGQQVRGMRPKGVATRKRRRLVRKRRFSPLQRRRHALYVRRTRAAALRSAHLYAARTGIEPMKVQRGKRKRWLRRG